MKYSETGFRPLYHNFCIFPMVENVKKVAEALPESEDKRAMIRIGAVADTEYEVQGLW